MVFSQCNKGTLKLFVHKSNLPKAQKSKLLCTNRDLINMQNPLTDFKNPLKHNLGDSDDDTTAEENETKKTR